MSYVTDIILVTMIDDGMRITDNGGGKHNVAELNAFLFNNYNGTMLIQVQEHTNKRSMQCDVFISAVNHLDIDEFMRVFYGIEWEYPDNLQLMIKEERDNLFTVHNYKSRFLIMP